MSNKEQKDIIDKVRKLLSINPDNATQGEVENAMMFAQRLIRKHNLNEDELIMSSHDVAITEIANQIQRPENTFWQWDLLRVIGGANNCKVYRSGWKNNYFYKVVGLDEDRIMVESIFTTLVPLIRQMYKVSWKIHKQQPEPDTIFSYVRSYIKGFISGVNTRLQDDKKDFIRLDNDGKKYELMIFKKDALVMDFVSEKMGPIKSCSVAQPKSFSGAGYASGKKDGKQGSYRNLLGN